MRIYTKTGDKGTTSLFGGKRISKTDPQIEACGTIDELTSIVGLITSKTKEKEKVDFLQSIQVDLYKIMSVVSLANTNLNPLEESIKNFEKRIDGIEKKYPTPTRFILPGKPELTALSHLARTICRRAERNTIYFLEQKNINETVEKNKPLIITYLNRLSDLLFMLAREYAKGKEVVT